MKKLKKGFTLVELILVIAIIGILGTMGFTSYSTSLQKSRDSRRKADLQQIMTALQLYYNDNGKYPPAGACAPDDTTCYVDSSNLSDPWLPALTTGYIKSVPRDPLNSGKQPFPWVTGDYYYAYGDVTTDGQSFDLITQLEWKSDPDRCEIKHYKQKGGASGGVDWCGPNSNYLYQQTPP